MEENKTHFFNIENAKKYGVEEAIILENINFWIEKNRANNRHFYEGQYWTYNSVSAFQKLFPYWKETKIRRILESLENQGVIKKGNFNKSAYDRTLWYSINGESICQKRKMEKAESENGFNESGEPIPDINTDDKPDNKTNNNVLFSQFWKTYPNKKGKQKSQKLFASVIKKIGIDQLNSALKNYIKEIVEKKIDSKYILHGSTFLGGRYEDYLSEIELFNPEKHIKFKSWESLSDQEKFIRNGKYYYVIGCEKEAELKNKKVFWE